MFRGHEPTPGAVDTLAAVTARTLYVTNNASRGPSEVAQHLRAMGFTAAPDDVVTSAQSAAHLLAERLPAGAPVLIVGTESLAAEIRNAGLKPVRLWSDDPVAVVQGHSPETAWPDYRGRPAIRGGAVGRTTSPDAARTGLIPENGSMVAALQAATDREPKVAGKPQPTLLTDALSRGNFRTPLVVGDRLDTDIAGANAAGLPSLLVLSGVSTADETVRAAAGERPNYIAADLRSLYSRADALRVGPHPAWRIDIGSAVVTVHNAGSEPRDPLTVVRATANAVWNSGLDGQPFAIVAGDYIARKALERWSLLTSPID